jgi:hypothetical protein
MDDLVKAAMAKWPHVPDCKGWLGLDERGDWYMRDDRVQAQGDFPQAKGARIEHEALKGLRRGSNGAVVFPKWPPKGVCGTGQHALDMANRSDPGFAVEHRKIGWRGPMDRA